MTLAPVWGLLALAAPSRGAALPRPALDELAWRVVEQAEAARPEPPVGVYVEGAPEVLARAFASAVASQLAGRRRGPSVLEAKSAAEAEALARGLDLRTLLRLSVQLDGPRLVARGDAIETWVSFWAGAHPRRGQAVALAAAVDADADAQALGSPGTSSPPPPGTLKLALSSLARLSQVPAALAFGDADGDGKGELWVLQDDGLYAIDPDGRPRLRSELREVPPAPSPCREPFGALAVSGGRVLVASARKARPASLTSKGGRLEPGPAEGPAQSDGVAVRLAPGLNVFERQIGLGGKPLELPGPINAASARGPLALVVYPDATAMVLQAAVPPSRLSGVGAGSALADLDGDGTPEVFFSSPRHAVDTDELKVLSLAQALALQARSASVLEVSPLWQGATPRGRVVTALGADLDGDAAEELVLGVWLGDGTGELWVARALK